MSRSLVNFFGTMPDGSNIPLPYTDTARTLAGAAFDLCDKAHTGRGDTLVALTLLHSASLVVAELNERMERYRLWIPPIPPVPMPTVEVSPGHT